MSMKKLFAGIAGIVLCAGICRLASALDLRTIEDDATWNQYHAKSSANTSTHAIVGIGLSYAIRPVGGDVVYHVIHPTKTYSIVGVDPSSVSTSFVTVISSDVLSARWDALTINPNIVIDSLTTGATVYIYVDYADRRK